MTAALGASAAVADERFARLDQWNAWKAAAGVPAELTPQEKLALVDRISAMTPKRLETDSADLIREDRDTR